jgi:hypothetical protein
MGEFEPSLQEHLCQVSQGKLVSEAPQDNEQDNLGGELKMVELSAGTLIGLTLAVPATEDLIPKGGLLGQLAGRGR